MMAGIEDLDYDPVVEIIEDVIERWVATNLGLAEAGAWNDEQLKAFKQARHLHLAEPWLPAMTVRDRLRAAGLLAETPA